MACGSWIALVLASVAGGPGHDGVRLVELGPDCARGVLINRSWGSGPCDPYDPNKLTVVVVHGLNPFHPMFHFAVGDRYAEALQARFGDSINIAVWDWNAATGYGLRPVVTQTKSVRQGQTLAECLIAQGLHPARVHLIGQSAGCMVVTSAARRLQCRTGETVARLTIIDPARAEHPLLFGSMRAGMAASRVEHLWVPGSSGFGMPARTAGVVDIAVPGPSGWCGLINPCRSDHLNAVRWHIAMLSR